MYVPLRPSSSTVCGKRHEINEYYWNNDHMGGQRDRQDNSWYWRPAHTTITVQMWQNASIGYRTVPSHLSIQLWNWRVFFLCPLPVILIFFILSSAFYLDLKKWCIENKNSYRFYRIQLEFFLLVFFFFFLIQADFLYLHISMLLFYLLNWNQQLFYPTFCLQNVIIPKI